MKLSSFFLCFLLGLTLFSCQNNTVSQPKAVNGVIDLSEWNFTQNGSVNLNGEWAFHWQTFADRIEQSDSTDYVKIPDHWYNYTIDGKKLPSYGYATFHLTIRHRLTNQVWGINFPDICACYNAYINGKLIAKCGKFSTNYQTLEMMVHPQLVFFYCNTNVIDLRIEVANYIEVACGIPDPIYLGPQYEMNSSQVKKMSFEFISFGILMITGFYHLFLYLVRRSEKYNLFFSLFNFTLAAKTSFEGDKFLYILFPDFSNHLYLALWCISICASISFIYLYFYYLFKKDTNRELMIFWQFVFGIYAAIIIFFPVTIFNGMLSIFQFLALPAVCCILYAIIRAVINKRDGALLVLIAVLVAFLSAVNDLIYGLGIIRTGFIVPYGFLLFVVIQSYLISVRFSQAFVKNERISKELKTKNTEYLDLMDSLEEKVEERTLQLAVINEELNAEVEERRQTEEQLWKANEYLKERNQVVEAELNLARMIQRRMLPTKTIVPNLAFFYKSMEKVGGDYYDFIPLSDGKIGIFISDVSGHGVPAAFVMTMLKTLVLQAKKVADSPAEFLNYLNNALFNQIGGNFITAFYAVFDPVKREIVCANAGHNLPFYITEDSELQLQNVESGFPLALFDNDDLWQKKKLYSNHRLMLKKKSKLLLYTDGLSEAVRPGREEEEFAEIQLMCAIRDLKELKAPVFLAELASRLIEFRGSDNFDDDVCMICLDV